MTGIDEVVLNFSPASMQLLNAILAIVMFSIAIDLTAADFHALTRAPKPLQFTTTSAARNAPPIVSTSTGSIAPPDGGITSFPMERD